MRKILYLLGQLTDADVEWLIVHGAKQRIPAGTVLIRERQPINDLYILLDGSLEVAPAGLDAKQAVRLACGEVVGEMSFVDARPPSATVTARDGAVVLAISRAGLAAKLAADCAFAARFYRALAMFLSQRLRATMSRSAQDLGRPLDEDTHEEDELDPNVLECLHVAGGRFERVLQRLLAE